MPIQLCEGYHASLVENESSAIGSCADKEPDITHLLWKMRVQPLDHMQIKSQGRAREAGEINKSLLTLGRVINALGQQAHTFASRFIGGKNKYLYYCYSITSYVNQRMMKSTLIKDIYGEIERPKAEIYAARERNGVYIPRERYFQEESERKAMADPNEQMGMTIENHKKQIEELQAKYDYQVQQSFDLGKQLDATQNNLNLTSKYHASLLENENSAIGSCADEERGSYFVGHQ
ncbi:hypothetical protein OROHE_018024 [Orobanche hederae]